MGMMTIPGQTVQPMQLFPSTDYNQQAVSQPVLNPKQEVIRVDGIEGAYKCVLPANTASIIIVDMYKPLAYLVTTNGINRQVTPFDIVPHKEPQIQSDAIYCSQKSETNNVDFAAMLTAINDRLTTMEVTINELKSDSGSFKSAKSNGKASRHANKSAGPTESNPGSVQSGTTVNS